MIVMLLISSTTTNAQWVTAAIPEAAFTGYGLTAVDGRSTGNDILEYSSNIFEVSVWDDNNDIEPGIGFIVNGGAYAATFSFSKIAGILDPDVCFSIDGSGDVHALAVYYDGSNGEFVLEDWIWTGSSFMLNNVWASGTIAFGTAVNIDADDASNFIIIYDDGISNDISIFTGDISTSLNINNSGVPVPTVSPGYFPDVCLYGNASDRVTYTYIEPQISSNNEVMVYSDDFSVLASGSNSSAFLFSDVSPADNFKFPRIACPHPQSINATFDDWMVVVGDETNSTIHGYKYNNSSGFNSYIYNNGSTMAYQDITNIPNLYPAVTYLYKSGNPPMMFIGWTMDNSSGTFIATPDAKYPIGLPCDENGAVLTSDYWDIPQNIGSSFDLDFVSLAGRNSDERLSSTFHVVFQSDVATKSVGGFYSTTSLRVANESEGLDEQILKSNPEIPVIGNLYDLNGKFIHSFTGSYGEVIEKIYSVVKIQTKSIYLIKIDSIDGKYSYGNKIYTKY